jgi:chromosomal replication initiator protein
MEEMTSAAEDLRRHVLAMAGAPQPDVALTILVVVARQFCVKVEEIVGSRRTSNLVVARQIAMAITRRLTTSTLQEIADRFGGRDHGTVLWAARP